MVLSLSAFSTGEKVKYKLGVQGQLAILLLMISDYKNLEVSYR